MANEDERRLILEMISSGKITAEEGLRLLGSLPAEEAEAEEEPGEEAAALGEPASAEPPPPPAPGPRQLEPPLSPPLEGSLPPAENLPPAEPESGAGTGAEPPAASTGASPAWAENAGSSSTGQPGEAAPPSGAPPGGAPHGEEPLQGEAVNSFRSAGLPGAAERWRRWWRLPMAAGVVLTVLGALLMFQSLQASGIGFWFLCAWLPFLLGVAVVALAWHSRTARWLHLRVQQPPGAWPRTIAISFPLPLGLAAWSLRTFRTRIPGMQAPDVDEMLVALERSATPENPLYLEVEEGENGERVEILIG